MFLPAHVEHPAVPVHELPDTAIGTVRAPSGSLPDHLQKNWEMICFLSDLPMDSKTSCYVKTEQFGSSTDRKVLFRVTKEVLTLLRQKGRTRRAGHLQLPAGNYEVWIGGKPLLETCVDEVQYQKFAMK